MHHAKLSPGMGIEIHSGTLADYEGTALESLLAQHGAVLFRDFGVTSQTFEAFTQTLTTDFLVHHDVGRRLISEDGTVQTVAGGRAYLPAHIERGYAPPVPDVVFFLCVRPAREGGETTLYDGFDLFDALRPATQRFLIESRMLWRLQISPEKWHRALQTDDAETATALLEWQRQNVLDATLGQVSQFRFEGDTLHLEFRTPCVRRATRREGWCFANSGLSYLHGWQNDPSIELWLDGHTKFPIEILQEVQRAAEERVIPIRWGAGDFVAIDNRTVLHGRRSFEDPGREIYTRIGLART